MTEPQRTCVGCRKRGDRSSLVRYVIIDGQLVRDDRAVLPGRGAWVHDDEQCLQQALRRGGFSRAFHRPVSLDPSMLRVASGTRWVR